MLYEDVLSFFSQTQDRLHADPGRDLWRARGRSLLALHTDVWTHPILSRHVPPHILQPANVRRTMAPEEDYVDEDSAREAKKLADRGVLVSIGAHGQQDGLGSHWELWSFVRGGMTPDGGAAGRHDRRRRASWASTRTSARWRPASSPTSSCSTPTRSRTSATPTRSPA